MRTVVAKSQRRRDLYFWLAFGLVLGPGLGIAIVISSAHLLELWPVYMTWMGFDRVPDVAIGASYGLLVGPFVGFIQSAAWLVSVSQIYLSIQ
jgi:hypothetical protein